MTPVTWRDAVRGLIASAVSALVSAGAPAAQVEARAESVHQVVGKVFGRVVDERGQPVAGAEVMTRRDAEETLPDLVGRWRVVDDRIERRTRTDDQGRFVLEIDRHGHYGVEARKGQELGSRLLWPIAAGQTLTLVARPLVERRGRVRAPGPDGKRQAVAGASVHIAVQADRNLDSSVEFVARLEPLPELKTDDSGRFRFTVPAGTNGTAVAVDERGTARRVFDADGAQDVELILEGSEPVHGKVVDASSGAALEDVQVCWWGLGENVTSVVRSDTQGRFALPRMAGKPYLFAAAAGYGLLVSPVPPSEGASRDAPLRIEMNTRGRVTGRLLDGAGAPLAHAAFLIQSGAETATGSSFPSKALDFQTDERGSFAIGGASFQDGIRGWVRVEDMWVRFCAVASAEDVDLGDVRIAPTARVVGRIRDVDGSPASGIKVFVLPLDQPTNPSLDDARTVHADTSGRFEMRGLLPGRYRIHSYSTRSLACSVDVTASPGARPIEIGLEKAETLRGRVSQAGEPRAGALVSYYPDNPEVLPVSPPTTVTDALGQFTLPCIWGEELYRPHARIEGATPTEGESGPVTPGTYDVEIRLR